MFPHPRIGRREADEKVPDDAPENPSRPSPSRAAPKTEAGGDAVVHPPAAIERLSLVEVVVAELGGWAGAICYRCHLPAGPFLASDGVVHLDLAVFGDETRERASESATE